MGSSFSSVVIAHKVLDIVLPVFDGVVYVASWLHSVVDVVDKCFESLPRGPGVGSLPELEVTINSGSSSGATNADHFMIEKVRNSLKAMEMSSIAEGCHGDEAWCDDHLCAVCLAEISGEEKMYELPLCRHIFHTACLDRWVAHNHSTCPLCRTSLITSYSGQEEEVEEEAGLYLGIWRVPRFPLNLITLSSYGGWRQSIMRLAGYQ